MSDLQVEDRLRDRLAALERELAEARAERDEVARVLELERTVGHKCVCNDIINTRMTASRELRHAFGIGDYDGVDEGQRKAIEGMRKLRAEVEAAFRAGMLAAFGEDDINPVDAWSRYQQERQG